MAVELSKPIITAFIVALIFGIKTRAVAQTQTLNRCDIICGKWMIAEKNLKVEIYKDGDQFRAKIIWFDDSDDKTQPMDKRMDTENPDPNMRTQKILGSSILQNLIFIPATNTWENGIIYDGKHGKYWQSAAYINDKGELKVTGYWKFKFIGKTLTFTRVSS